MQTKIYRQQHGEILRHLDALDRLVTSAPEQDVCLELSRLAGIVKLHLALEDKNMYPSMLRHEDPLVQSTAREYMDSMDGELAPVYVAFHEKWIANGSIESSRLQFIQEFRRVSDALRQRIDRENRGLYDLIDNKDISVAV